MKAILLQLLKWISLVGCSESGNETLGLQKCGEFPNCLSVIIFSSKIPPHWAKSEAETGCGVCGTPDAVQMATLKN